MHFFASGVESTHSDVYNLSNIRFNWHKIGFNDRQVVPVNPKSVGQKCRRIDDSDFVLFVFLQYRFVVPTLACAAIVSDWITAPDALAIKDGCFRNCRPVRGLSDPL